MPITRTRYLAWRLTRALAAPLLLGGLLAGLVPSSAIAASAGVAGARCRNRAGNPPVSPGSEGSEPHSVAVLSAALAPDDIWAVGLETQLDAVAAGSAGNAWAVGQFVTSGPEQALAEHWDGSSWKVAKGPPHCC